MLLWQEHATQHPGQRTHRYTQFCENYRGSLQKTEKIVR